MYIYLIDRISKEVIDSVSLHKDINQTDAEDCIEAVLTVLLDNNILNHRRDIVLANSEKDIHW